MKGYRKILIAINGSKEVLEQGLTLARDEDCWVTVVKVIPPYEGGLHLTGIKDLGSVLDSGGEKEVREIKELAKSGKTLVKTRLEEGEVHEKIIEIAEDEQCDLIVMGKNRTNWFKKIFGKNIVEKVISVAPCPVLLVGTM